MAVELINADKAHLVLISPGDGLEPLGNFFDLVAVWSQTGFKGNYIYHLTFTRTLTTQEINEVGRLMRATFVAPTDRRTWV